MDLDFLPDGRPCVTDDEHIAPCLECQFGANRAQGVAGYRLLCDGHKKLAREWEQTRAKARSEAQSKYNERMMDSLESTFCD